MMFFKGGITCRTNTSAPHLKFGFGISGHSGSHVRLSKITPKGKVGTVVPLHKELKIGTLRGLLKLAKVDLDEFAKYL